MINTEKKFQKKEKNKIKKIQKKSEKKEKNIIVKIKKVKERKRMNGEKKNSKQMVFLG